ncbi:hypothetical protein MNV84_02056 [Leishmania braziliensis]|nr:hypothetical protein MNV84_02056 [Leishmania braziliensis]
MHSTEGGHPLLPKAATTADDSSCTLAARKAARPHSLLDLDDDVFNYICSYVPVDDLLRNVAAASHDTRRRTSASNALWQQLWMRYLLLFYNSLIPPTTTAASPALSPASPTLGLGSVALPDTMGTLHTATTTPPRHDSIWHLYHFRHSTEARPHVVQLEKLRLIREDITDPAAAESPISRRTFNQVKTSAIHAQLLSFAQACATQPVAWNLTYMTPVSTPSSDSPPVIDRGEGVTQCENLAQRSAWLAHKQQQRQTDRLQRALHFLLSASDHRPRFHDQLWGDTDEAEKEFIRYAQAEAEPTASKPDKQQNTPSSLSHSVAAPLSLPVRLRPMSWLDQETSVKVLLFDDDTRSIGDAAAVQEERSKLLDSITQNWRIAYASHFYPRETDGNDSGSPLRHLPVSSPPASATAAATAGGGAARPRSNAERDRQQQEPVNGGRATWEQVYRRFRDGNSGTTRGAAGIQQRAATRTREVGSSNDDATIPSSGNPLFDMHLLGYEKRKQVYAAMLASTVEVPDGMGVFFGTCVSESFLRWWCCRNQRRMEASQAPAASPTDAVGYDRGGLPARRHIVLAPFTTAGGDTFPPPSLWVVQVAVRDPRASIKRNEATAESVTYSSSYSDVATTASSASSYTFASPSISFTEEREEESHPVAAEGTSVLETAYAAAAGEEPASPSRPAPTLLHHVPVAVLFPLPHMLTYWFMMHHVSFYSHQVYRRMGGDQELTIAVWSRILSPTGHSAECRLFYSLRCATFPRMFTKMMFTPGVLPSLTLPDKMTKCLPYCSSPSSSSARNSYSSADTDSDGGDTSGSSSISTDKRPVDSRQIYELFWTGFGRVEVDSGPTISRSNMVRLRIALGLPLHYPMGLLWNVVMFASGIGPLILKEHRHSLHLNYSKTFTDIVAGEFGELACYGLGAQLSSRRNDATAMANPLDAEMAAMQGRHAIAIVAPTVGQGLAVRTTDDNDREAHQADVQASSAPIPADHNTPSTTVPPTDVANWSGDLNSDFSNDEDYWSRPGSDTSASEHF